MNIETKGAVRTKDATYFKICNAVMKLEVSKGHLVWRLSDIAKEADVTRSLIYYYFGKEKEIILGEAFRYMIDLFFNLDRKDSMGLVERINFVIKQMKSMPWVFILFYLQKDQDTEVGELLKSAEEKLLTILQKDFPEMSHTDILKIYLLQLGSVCHKRLDEKDLSEVFNR